MAQSTVSQNQEITAKELKPGMWVKVYQKIKETSSQGKEKERLQVFEGLVIARNGDSETGTVTVRKMSDDVGVEKVMPVNLPSIAKIELLKQYKVRRAKLYYTRKEGEGIKKMREIV